MLFPHGFECGIFACVLSSCENCFFFFSSFNCFLFGVLHSQVAEFFCGITLLLGMV